MDMSPIIHLLLIKIILWKDNYGISSQLMRLIHFRISFWSREHARSMEVNALCKVLGPGFSNAALVSHTSSLLYRDNIYVDSELRLPVLELIFCTNVCKLLRFVCGIDFSIFII